MKRINYRLVMFSLALSSFIALVQAQTPEWIWSSKSPGAEEVVFFRKVITVPENLGQAILVVACDNEATVWVNGKQVARNTEWSKASRANVSRQLKAGPNVIAVEAKNHGSAAGLLVQLTLVQGVRKRRSVRMLLECESNSRSGMADRGKSRGVGSGCQFRRTWHRSLGRCVEPSGCDCGLNDQDIARI